MSIFQYIPFVNVFSRTYNKYELKMQCARISCVPNFAEYRFWHQRTFSMLAKELEWEVARKNVQRKPIIRYSSSTYLENRLLKFYFM